MKTFYGTFGKKLIKQLGIFFSFVCSASVGASSNASISFDVRCLPSFYPQACSIHIIHVDRFSVYAFAGVVTKAWRVIHSANHADSSVEFGKAERERAGCKQGGEKLIYWMESLWKSTSVCSICRNAWHIKPLCAYSCCCFRFFFVNSCECLICLCSSEWYFRPKDLLQSAYQHVEMAALSELSDSVLEICSKLC